MYTRTVSWLSSPCHGWLHSGGESSVESRSILYPLMLIELTMVTEPMAIYHVPKSCITAHYVYTYLQLISIHACMPIIYTNNCAKNQKLYLRSVTLCIWSFSEHILKHSTTLQAWLSTLGKRTSHMYRWVHACLGLCSTAIFTFNMENCSSCSQKGRQMQLLSSAA